MSFNFNLILTSFILLCCYVVKGLMVDYQIHFLPLAGGCILVGAMAGLISNIIFDGYIENNVHFDDELFLSVLMPPIAFEAALSVNKTAFRKKRLPIFMFAIAGTFLSTILTGMMVYYGTKYIDSAPNFPLTESMSFGALISSVDPVAILSVLAGLKVPETDTIYILVFGESLLNDAVAITLFKSLIRRDVETWDLDYFLSTLADFLTAGFGSMFIALLFAGLCLAYFFCMHGKLTPAMEVCSFFLWALIPYYISNALEWSGIVSIVTIGFILDSYVGGTMASDSISIIPTTAQHQTEQKTTIEMTSVNDGSGNKSKGDNGENEEEARGSYSSTKYLSESVLKNECNSSRSNLVLPTDLDIMLGKTDFSRYTPSVADDDTFFREDGTYATKNLRFPGFKYKMSTEAYGHVRFVVHWLASLSEDAIFAYLGVFLFSSHYNWNIWLVSISITSCVVSRIIMVVAMVFAIWHIHKLCELWTSSDCANNCNCQREEHQDPTEKLNSNEPYVPSQQFVQPQLQQQQPQPQPQQQTEQQLQLQQQLQQQLQERASALENEIIQTHHTYSTDGTDMTDMIENYGMTSSTTNNIFRDDNSASYYEDINSPYCNIDCLPRYVSYDNCNSTIQEQEQQRQYSYRYQYSYQSQQEQEHNASTRSKTIQELQQRSVQLVLVLAGLRGAVSLALVESMPTYNEYSNSYYNYSSSYYYDDNANDNGSGSGSGDGTGTMLKSELQAMTSATIIFTIFIFGGSAHYILRRLDLNLPTM